MSGILPYIIVCPLVFLASLVDSIAGGGGLISLPAYLLAGLPPHRALASNKFSSCLGTVASTWHFLRQGYILKSAVWYVAAALIGSALGARLTLFIAADILRYMMLVILPVTAVLLSRLKQNFEPQEHDFEAPTRKNHLIATALALGIGFYDGFYGPGTGTFLIIGLTLWAKFSPRHAAGTTKAINLASNVAALAVFLYHGQVLFPLAAVAAVFSIAGHWTGARLVTLKGIKIMRPLLFLVLGLLFAKTIWELVA